MLVWMGGGLRVVLVKSVKSVRYYVVIYFIVFFMFKVYFGKEYE